MTLAVLLVDYESLTRTIIDSLREQTGMVIDDLCIETVVGRCVILTGRADSWHAKQMASTVTQRVLVEFSLDLRIENHLIVRTPR